MMFLKKWLWYFAILFVFFSVTAAKAQAPIQVIPMPAKIGGTVTVDGIQLTQATAAGYTFVVTKQDGTTLYIPAAEDTDGLNTSDWYGIDIPIYDAADQPGGASPGDTAIIHVYKNASELTVTSPGNGQFTVGAEGSTTPMDLEAVSTQTTHTVTFTAGAGGTLTGSTTQTVNDGGDCTPVEAVPDSGYQFTGWTGDYVGTENPLTIINVTTDMNITANFALPGSHTVTFTAGSGGSLTGTTPQTVDDGGDCTPVTAVPDAGYQFTGWTGDYTGTDNPLTITNVTSDMNITANFAVPGGPAAAVPTLNEWGMIILMGSFFILALYILRRRNTAGA